MSAFARLLDAERLQLFRAVLLQSLLATGLNDPADVLQHCLALFRKADLEALQQYLPASYADALTGSAHAAASNEPNSDTASSSISSTVGGSSSSISSPTSSRAAGSRRAPPALRDPWLAVPEAGPLAALAGVLDVGARRVLPGHLLRRSQVLATLRPAPGVFQQRVSLTACTGETSVFDWQLAWHPAAAVSEAALASGDSSSSSSSDSGGASCGSACGSLEPGTGARGGWVIESVRRDPSCDMPLPTTPHPK